jgi:hypothetical protein
MQVTNIIVLHVTINIEALHETTVLSSFIVNVIHKQRSEDQPYDSEPEAVLFCYQIAPST